MASPVTERVTARIVALRQMRGMTQGDLAVKAGLHRVSLANIERGVKQPTLTTLDRIAKALRVKLIDLVK